MSGNRFGTLFQYQTFGESHGPAIGAIVDGVPSLIDLKEADIQKYLDRRKPGQSKYTTQRREADEVKILSGVFEGKTTGTPIGLLIENQDQRSKDYGDIKDKFRPGHADYTYFKKYGIRDYRGGGRSSARETAMRVAAGAIARKVLEHDIAKTLFKPEAHKQSAKDENQAELFDEEAAEETPEPFNPEPGRAAAFLDSAMHANIPKNIKVPEAKKVVGADVLLKEFSQKLSEGQEYTKRLEKMPVIRAAVVQVGSEVINRDNWDWAQVDQNPLWCPDPQAVQRWQDYLDGVRKSGSSAGAIIECVASNIPAGLGAPVYDKLDSDLAKAMMSINAVKAVEIGNGFESARLGGEDNADEIRIDEDGNPEFLSNNAGGILGGISTGQDIIVRVAFKPTSSILTPRATIDKAFNETDIVTKGRHDPCVGLRGTPVVEAMMACVLADHWLRYKAQSL